MKVYVHTIKVCESVYVIVDSIISYKNMWQRKQTYCFTANGISKSLFEDNGPMNVNV